MLLADCIGIMFCVIQNNIFIMYGHVIFWAFKASTFSSYFYSQCLLFQNEAVQKLKPS